MSWDWTVACANTLANPFHWDYHLRAACDARTPCENGAAWTRAKSVEKMSQHYEYLVHNITNTRLCMVYERLRSSTHWSEPINSTVDLVNCVEAGRAGSGKGATFAWPTAFEDAQLHLSSGRWKNLSGMMRSGGASLGWPLTAMNFFWNIGYNIKMFWTHIVFMSHLRGEGKNWRKKLRVLCIRLQILQDTKCFLHARISLKRS